MFAVILTPLLPLLAALIVLVRDEGSRNLRAKIAAFPIGTTLDQLLLPSETETMLSDAFNQFICSNDVETLLMTPYEAERSLSSHEHKSNRYRG